MPAARWTSALVGALATACFFAAPAFADSCGNPGYSYAGVVTQKRTAGVQAAITAPVAPQVESGDVSLRTARSARAIWRRHVFLYPLAALACRAGLAPAELMWHFQASIEQKGMHCATDNLLMFGYLVAVKPL